MMGGAQAARLVLDPGGVLGGHAAGLGTDRPDAKQDHAVRLR